MKIGILSRNNSLYSTKRLYEEAFARGHTVEVIDTLRCYMNITSKHPQIHYKGKPLLDFSAIIPRIGAKITFYGTAVVRQFEMMGVYCVNESVAITRSRDKLRALQILSKKGIGMPITGFASSLSDIQDLIDIAGGSPLVIKILHGTQGNGVVLAETKQAAESVIEAFYGLKENILVQEFIEESKGCDVRCFVIGDKVVAAMERKSAAGDFRSNLHKGGTAQGIKITPEERKMALDATRGLGLNISGVDILRSHKGPLVMEVNSSPGLEGIENVTGVNIARKIIKYIEENAEKGARKTRGTG